MTPVGDGDRETDDAATSGTAPRGIAALVVGYLEARSLPYQVGRSGTVVAFPASTASHSWTVYAIGRDAHDQLLVHSARDEAIPDDRRDAVGAFVNRVNFGMVLGNLEIDLDDGEVRFKTSIDVESDRLSEALINHLVLSNIASFGRYLPGIDAVVAGEDPAAAVASIESGHFC